MSLTVEAIYQDGVFKPLQKLALPNNQKVKITIIVLDKVPEEISLLPSLCGAFPELAKISDEDIAWAKGLWERGLEKQMRLLSEGK